MTDTTTVVSPASPATAAPLREVGALIRGARKGRSMTQAQLAERVGTSQSAINRIEQGGQNLSLEMLTRISDALDQQIVSIGGAPQRAHLRVQGGRKLSGSIAVNSSKNAAVALLCASLLNRGVTRLHKVARIVEVDRIIDVLRSLGASVTWSEDGETLEIVAPSDLRLDAIDADAARRTRSVLMFLGPLSGRYESFRLPYAGGCDLGTRTVEPHLIALRPFGVDVEATSGWYEVGVANQDVPTKSVVLTERGDTVTENAILAAAARDGETVIRNASPNYMVQDLCFFLELLGVQIEGIGTTTLRITGKSRIDEVVDYWPSEDPVEAMSLLTAGIVTDSTLTVTRAPIEFLEIELATLAEMGLRFDVTDEYAAANGRTRLVDITVHPSELHAPIDKIHAMPFPGLNIDNLPFFVVIAAMRRGHHARARLGVRGPGDPPARPDPPRRERHPARPAPPRRHRSDALLRRRDQLPAGAPPRGGHPAGDARGEGRERPAQRRHHRPRLRAAAGAPQLARRVHRDVPRLRRPPTRVT